MVDVLFISPSNSQEVYQDLSASYAAIEPPTWALLLAQAVRAKGHSVAILDTYAENLSDEESFSRIEQLNPKLICFVVYGQNVSAGVVSMSGAVRLSEYLKTKTKTPISYVGSYVQALPLKVLKEEASIDFVFTNEGVKALLNVLSLDEISEESLSTVKGIALRKNNVPQFTPPEAVVANLDEDLPGYAWDLLPDLKLYRSPMWHAEYDEKSRTPYAAIQTSLGCRFNCGFCIINIINRNDEKETGIAGDYSKMRHWSPEFIIKEFDKLADLGIFTIKITDELFLLNKNFYVPICKMLSEKWYRDKLKLWVYSRVDTVSNPETLSLLRDAGVKYIALGIESSSRDVRLEISKGKFKDVKIKEVVDQIHEAGIEVMANYMFGLPGDTEESMQDTLDLSIELCTSGWNAYAAMALPGSQLYADAVAKGHKLPQNYSGYSFHSYDSVCSQTDSLEPWQILKFRDEAFNKYHLNEKFLDRIKNKYGQKQADNIKEMCGIKLKRILIDEAVCRFEHDYLGD